MNAVVVIERPRTPPRARNWSNAPLEIVNDFVTR